MLYHCNTGISGGYVGVDVFFVISGFLITSQLVRELAAKGRISFMGFYARRARRILPAATLTTVVTGVAAGLLVSPLPALRVFADARAAAVFGANIHFAQQGADYFNDSLTPSPIQHYWFLSIEEQFYFVWPLLLVVASLVWLGFRRRSPKTGGKSSAGARPVSGSSWWCWVPWRQCRSLPRLRRPSVAVVDVLLHLHARLGARGWSAGGVVAARG